MKSLSQALLLSASVLFSNPAATEDIDAIIEATGNDCDVILGTTYCHLGGGIIYTIDGELATLMPPQIVRWYAGACEIQAIQIHTTPVIILQNWWIYRSQETNYTQAKKEGATCIQARSNYCERLTKEAGTWKINGDDFDACMWKSPTTPANTSSGPHSER